MRLEKRFNRFLIMLFISFFLIVIMSFIGYKFIQHEANQQNAIKELQQEIYLLSRRIEERESDTPFLSSISETGFDYLAIGNSITVHPITDFWWGSWGMAASKAENDYYHIVLNELKSTYEIVNSEVFNYGVWEVQGHDRTETYEFLEKYLIEGIDLVTIQLSENVSDLDTFDIDLNPL